MAIENHSDEIARLIHRGEQDPRTHTFARLADLYRKAGDLDRALEVIQSGLKHHPHYLNARLVHARVLRQLGQPEAAQQAFERVLRIDSENLVARAALTELGAEVPELEAESGRPATRPDGPAAGRWLARLDADWRKVRAENGAGSGRPGEPSGSSPEDPVGPAADDLSRGRRAAGEIDLEVVSEEREGPVERPSAEAAEAAGRDVGEAPPPAEHSAEVETATLAALYLRQGLFDRAIAVYERLLARDPYNARLAGALEAARRRTKEGPKGPGSGSGESASGSPPDPLPSAPTGHATDRPEAASAQLRARRDRRATDAPQRTASDSAPEPSIRVQLGRILDGEAAGAAPDQAGRWSDWLDRLERGRD